MSAIDVLIGELARLPGIGRKTATRLTYHLLKQPKEQARRLADALVQVSDHVRPCATCGSMTDAEACAICTDPRRDGTVLCVVEEASDIDAIERSGEFRGVYHVLGGHVSPLDGVGPDDLRLEALGSRVGNGSPVREVIVATNPSMEGEVTATLVRDVLLGRGIRISRLALGLPVGGDLEYADSVTVARALTARQEMA